MSETPGYLRARTHGRDRVPRRARAIAERGAAGRRVGDIRAAPRPGKAANRHGKAWAFRNRFPRGAPYRGFGTS